jgi:hypothetical protein
MKDEQLKYLDSIGINGNVITRIESIIKQYSIILKEVELRDIFVCDYITEDKTRNYDSLWLFFDGYICESKNFLISDDFDCAKYSKSDNKYWNIQKEKYEMSETNDESRIVLRVSFLNTLKFSMKAAKNNCEELMRVFSTWIID